MYVKTTSTYLKGGNYLSKQTLKQLKILKHSDFKIVLEYKKLKFKKPKMQSETCLTRKKTYACYMYVPIQILYKGTKIIT